MVKFIKKSRFFFTISSVMLKYSALQNGFFPTSLAVYADTTDTTKDEKERKKE